MLLELRLGIEPGACVVEVHVAARVEAGEVGAAQLVQNRPGGEIGHAGRNASRRA